MPEEQPPPATLEPDPDRLAEVIRTDSAFIVPPPRNIAAVSSSAQRRAATVLG